MSSPSATTPPMTRVEKSKPTKKACVPRNPTPHCTHAPRNHTGIKNNTRVKEAKIDMTCSKPCMAAEQGYNDAQKHLNDMGKIW